MEVTTMIPLPAGMQDSPMLRALLKSSGWTNLRLEGGKLWGNYKVSKADEKKIRKMQ